MKFLRRAEEWLLAAILAAMMLIPVLESILRALLHTGISGSAAVLQQRPLVVSMLGAALAAREDRLLAFATAAFLSDRVKGIASIISSGVAAAVSVFLAISGYELVKSERFSGSRFVYDIPLWIVQCVLPLGFALIALRIILN